MRRIPAHVLSRTVDDEEVLLDLESQKYFGMNLVGTRIWRWIKRGMSEEKIARALTDEFDVSGDRARRDVRAFLDELERRGLLTL